MHYTTLKEVLDTVPSVGEREAAPLSNVKTAGLVLEVLDRYCEPLTD